MFEKGTDMWIACLGLCKLHKALDSCTYEAQLLLSAAEVKEFISAPDVDLDVVRRPSRVTRNASRKQPKSALRVLLRCAQRLAKLSLECRRRMCSCIATRSCSPIRLS